MYYLALVIEAPDGLDFICPDVPGFTAHSASHDFGQAVAVARQVFAGHLATLIDAGGELPRARDMAELRSDPEFVEDFAEAATTVLLPALVPAGRSVRVNLSLDENTLALIELERPRSKPDLLRFRRRSLPRLRHRRALSPQ